MVGVGVRRARRRTSSLLTLALVAAMVPFGAAPASAATFTVCIEGCDYLTIEAAVEAANAAPGADTILVDPGVYEEVLDIAEELTIQGTAPGVIIRNPGLSRPIIDANADFTLIDVEVTGGDSVEISGGAINANSLLTLDGVTVSDSSATIGGGVFFNGAGLTIIDSLFVGNSSSFNGGALFLTGSFEGGIYNSRFTANSAVNNGGAIYQSSGFLEIFGSTLDGNGAGDGGAVFQNGGFLATTASTVYQNIAENFGAGFYVNDSVSVDASTIVGNDNATNGGAFYVGNDSAGVSLTQTILYQNGVDGAACAGFLPDMSDYYGSGGYNFFENAGICPIAVAEGPDILDGGDPVLGAFSSDFTPVLAPLAESPVIDAAPAMEGVDQLGTLRPQGPGNDIGSVEVVQGGGDNTPPVAEDDFVTAAADTWVRVDVLDNDFDADGDELVISDAVETDFFGCQLDISAGTCIAYAGDGEFFGGEYTASDGVDTDDAVVQVTGKTLFEGTASPTIDGIIGEGEWTADDTFDVALGSGTALVGLANDSENLYIRINTSDFPADNADVYVFLGGGSDILRFTSAEGLEDLHFEEGSYVPDAQQDGSGASIVDGNVRVIEIAHPLDSGDFDDIAVSPGDTIQFALSISLEGGDSAATTQIPSGDQLELLDWRMVSTGPDIVGVGVSTLTPSVSTGFALPLANVPTDRLIAAAERVAGVSSDEAEIEGSPLGSIPLGSIPLGSIATDSVGTVVLSDLTIEGGWARLLVGTSLEGRPLQTVTLAEAIAAIPPDVLAAVPLEDLGIGDTSAGDLSLASLVLGDATLAELGLTCPADVAGCDVNTTTVVDVESRGGSITSVPLGSIPLGSIPLGSIPLGSIPLGSIPLGSIPLGSIGDTKAAPLGAIPLGSIGDLAAAPLGSIPLGSIPLGSIPLGSIPLGSIPLGSIPLGSIPLGAIDVGGDFCTFHDGAVGVDQTCAALGIDPLTTTVANYAALLRASDLASTPLGSIPLGSIPLGSIPLGSIDVSAVPLGAIDLDSVDLAASPLGSIPLGSIPLGAIPLNEVCAATDTNPCDADTTLADWTDGLPPGTGLDATPLGSIPLGSIPLGSIPLGSIDLNAVSVAGTPLGSIPLGSIDLTASPLGSIPLGSIADVTALVDCAGPVNCATGTLADAYAIGAILDRVSLGQFVSAAGGCRRRRHTRRCARPPKPRVPRHGRRSRRAHPR